MLLDNERKRLQWRGEEVDCLAPTFVLNAVKRLRYLLLCNKGSGNAGAPGIPEYFS
jgi:hypothetical protein